jgi:hypothetical protein
MSSCDSVTFGENGSVRYNEVNLFELNKFIITDLPGHDSNDDNTMSC